MKTQHLKRYSRRLESLGEDGRRYKSIALKLGEIVSAYLTEPIFVEALRYRHTYEVHLQDKFHRTIFWGGYHKQEKYAWKSFCEDVIGIGECGKSFCLNEYLANTYGELVRLIPENIATIDDLESFVCSK